MKFFNFLAEFLNNSDPWWMIAFALILILVDWIYAQTTALLVVGVALVICAVINALGFSGQVQLWFIPVALFIGYFGQKKLFTLLTSNKSPYTDQAQTLIGETGVFVITHTTNESESYFYEYKKDIHVEHEHKLPILTNLKVILNRTGETYPAIDASSQISNGAKVVVVAEVNGSLSVINKGE